MARNPIERALGVWSAANYRNVMLPGLGVVTCGELCDALADLKAENDEQRERLIQFANAFDAGYAAAERALAERARGVKVAELVDGLLDLRDLITRGKRCVTDTGPAVKPVIELASVHILDDAANALEALTTEPAAPEGRQEDEPRAYIVHAPEDDYCGTGPDRLQFHPLAQHDLDNGYRQTPLYERPAHELSGNTGELIDKMAEAIRDWGSHYDDGPWETLPEDRKAGWRGDAERALAVVKEYLTARRPAEQAVTDEMVEAAASQLGFGSADSVRIRAAIKAAMEADR